MTATLRFGTPPPDAAEQVTLQTRWGDPTVPKRGGWRSFFPYAMGVTATAHVATFRVIGGSGTESYELNNETRVRNAFYHPDSGIARNGLNAIAYFNARSTFETIATVADGTPIRVIQGIHQDLDTEWMPLDDATASQATLDGILNPALALYDDHPSVIAYVFEDDFSGTATNANRAEEAMQRIPELDSAGRPASPSILSGDNLIDPAAMDQVLLFGGGLYPCRWVSTGVKRVEGDFTRFGGTDWADAARAYVTAYPDANIWYWAQGHQLGDGSVNTLHLAYPTPAEIRKQVWELVGSGVKGIFWFIYNDMPELPSVGLGHPDSRARMDAIAEMGHRLSPGIMQRLLTATPVADWFTASGGGSGGTWLHQNYANAFISTLQDRTTGAYLCVVCNRSTSTASITIDAPALSGNLVNLETGVTVPLGSSVTLPKLDGTIFRFVPGSTVSAFGVPHYVPDGSWTTEEAWAEHWTNPASPNYVATGDIGTWPNQVAVSGGGAALQTAVDAAPDETTFVIAPGTYDGIYITAREHLHFIAADPLNKPVVHGVLGRGHIQLTDPLGVAPKSNYPGPNVGGYTVWVGKVVTEKDPSCIATYLDPPRDILFRDIRFEPVPGAITEHNYHDPATWRVPHVAGMVSADWPGRNTPCGFSGYADVCFERCEFRNWVYTNWEGLDTTGPMPFNHSGIFHNTGGIHNFVVRECDLECGLYQDGQGAWHTVFYMDGGMGCAFVYNNVTGPWKGFDVLLLCNDDLAALDDMDQDGTAGWDKVNEISAARYNFVVGNNAFVTAMRGFNNLIAENTMTYNGTMSLNTQHVVLIEAQCWKGGTIPSLPRLEYHFLDNVVRDNVFTGLSIAGSGTIVRHTAPSTACGNRVGQTTISGNSTTGTVANWYLNGSVDNDPSTALNNTDANGTRDGA